MSDKIIALYCFGCLFSLGFFFCNLNAFDSFQVGTTMVGRETCSANEPDIENVYKELEFKEPGK